MSVPVRRRRRAQYDAGVSPAGNPLDASARQHAHEIPPAEEIAPDAAPSVPAQEPVCDAPIPAPREVLATNTGVRLACTMAAMISLFALFLCWAEQESRVIRRFSVQSVLLAAVHAALGLGALLISSVLGGIPFFGLMVTLMCLVCYIAGLILLLIMRVKLMQHAWQGVRFALPAALERIVRRYY